MKNSDKSIRIAVVGAGASGLSMAYALKNQGFENVVVFEKRKRVGGKVFSIIEEKTGHTMELGAVWVPFAYKTIRMLIDEFKIEMVDAPEVEIADLSARANTRGFQKSLYLAYRRNRDKIKKYDVSKPGISIREYPELANSFHDFVQENGLHEIARAFLPLDTGCGYGFTEEVPAIYKMKFLSLVLEDIELRLQGRSRNEDTHVKFIKKGYQEIWKKVASEQDVRLETSVSRISYGEIDGKPGVTLVLRDERNGSLHEETFDRVMISSCGDGLTDVLDETSFSLEKQLFSHVETYPYYVSIFKATGLDAKKLESILLHENATNKKAGHPTIIAAPCPELDGNIYMQWTVAKHEQSDEEVAEKLKQDVARLGGKFENTILIKRWANYFPHVKKAALVDIDGNGGFYEQIESLQGIKGLYYAGGLMGFETVEQTSTFAMHLVREHFPVHQARSLKAASA